MCSKLRHIILLMSAGWLLSSCTSDVLDGENITRGSEVQFAVSELSRATITTSIDEFAVYGDKKSLVDNNTAPMVLFDKTKVEHKNNSWRYDGIQYWFPKHEHSFVAIHPLSVLESGNNPQYADSKLSFTYAIPNKVSDRNAIPDILAATHRRVYELDDPNNTTTFQFSHIMSLINLAPMLSDDSMGEDSYIEFHHLVLSGLKAQATFNITPAPRQTNLQTGDRVVEVTGQNGESELTINFASPVKVINGHKDVTLFDDDDAIIMLPQTFDAASKAQILLTYSINGNAEKKQVTIPLAESGSWESGKSYSYRFTISRTGVKIETTAITNWDVLNVGNINAH